jgi:hypothetical protein
MNGAVDERPKLEESIETLEHKITSALGDDADAQQTWEESVARLQESHQGRVRFHRKRHRVLADPLLRHHIRPAMKAEVAGKSISAKPSLAKASESKKTDEHIWLVTFMDYGWATSTMRHAGSNRSRTRSGQKCYLCLRYET